MEEKLKFIYENIQDVVWVLDVETRKMTYVSPSVVKLRGYTPEEVLEQRIEDTLTFESRKKIVGLLDKMIHEYYSGNKDTRFIGELEQYTRDGSTVWIEVVGSFIADESGRIKELLGVSRNITHRKIAQEKLEESERRYRELADFLPQIVYELDTEGHITFASNVAYEIFGFTEDDIINRRVKAYDFFIPEDIERMRQNRETIKSGNTTAVEFTARKRNGELFPVIIYASPIRRGGNIVGSRGIIADISDRKKMETALRHSEENYRKLIQSLQEGLFVIQNGKFTFLNESVVKIVGYSVEELQGRSFLDVIAPEKREEVAANHIKRLAGEISSSEYETLLFHKDGRRIPTMLSVCLTEYEGQTAIIGTAKDISDRYLAEIELKNRERRLNAILDAALVGISLGDVDGNILDYNQNWIELFGYSKDEMDELNFSDLIYFEDFQESTNFYNKLISGNIDSYNLEKRYVKKDGSVFWGQSSVRAIFNNDNEVVGLVTSVYDMTERKQKEAEMVKYQEKLKYELAKETIRSQFETLKNQVNPHFLFNSLNVLSSLIKLNPELAEDFTEQLAKVYRYVLEHKDKDIVSLATELDFLQSYIFLIEIRFKDKVKTHIDISADSSSMLIPTLALQLLIENAIKHNTFSKRFPLNINIYIDENNFLIVSNNFQPRELCDSKSSTGVGLQNLANRYSFLTDLTPSFGVEGNFYIAKLPLL